MRLDAVLRAGLLLSSQPLWGGDGGELAAAADGEAGAAAGLPVVRRDEIASALETLDGGGSADGADLPREASSDVAVGGGASCAHGTALGAVEGAAQLGRLAAAFQTWNDRPRGRPGQPHTACTTQVPWPCPRSAWRVAARATSARCGAAPRPSPRPAAPPVPRASLRTKSCGTTAGLPTRRRSNSSTAQRLRQRLGLRPRERMNEEDAGG